MPQAGCSAAPRAGRRTKVPNRPPQQASKQAGASRGRSTALLKWALRSDDNNQAASCFSTPMYLQHAPTSTLQNTMGNRTARGTSQSASLITCCNFPCHGRYWLHISCHTYRLSPYQAGHANPPSWQPQTPPRWSSQAHRCQAQWARQHSAVEIGSTTDNYAMLVDCVCVCGAGGGALFENTSATNGAGKG